MMQKQLLEMTDIPTQIQSKIAMVTKALEQFMTMDAEALESSWQRASMEREESSQETGSEKQFSTIEEEIEDGDADVGMENFDRETSYSFEDLVGDDRDIVGEEGEDEYEEYEEYEIEENNDEEQSICESINSEDMLKITEEKKKKIEKIQTLQKSWQKLCENQKTIHK
jgi:hypothetical protein